MADEGFRYLSGRVDAVASRLRIDAATAEVLRAFSSDGVECLLLKGRSIDVWLYPEGDRLSYLDGDLLIRPGDEESAANILRTVGFEPRFDEDALPDWWKEHAREWWRSADGVSIDIHRRLTGIGVDPETAWRTFTMDSETIDIAGYRASALGLTARAVHLALHAAHHGAEGPRGLGDLDRALEVVDDPLWERAADMAARLDATDAFAAGLRLRPAGAKVADRLRLPSGKSTEVEIRAATAPPVALGFEQLARATGWRARAAIVRHKLIPPAAFVRYWWPPAARSRRMLILGYVYRPLWILSRAPRGYRAWRAARGRVRRS